MPITTRQDSADLLPLLPRDEQLAMVACLVVNDALKVVMVRGMGAKEPGC